MSDGRLLRVLHVIINVGETNSQYNQLCLPLADVQDVSICSYFPTELQPPASIDLYSGEGRLMGFFRALGRALEKEPDVISVHAPQTGALVLCFALISLRWRRMRSKMVYTVRDAFYDYDLRDQALMLISLLGFSRIIFCSRAAYESIPRSAKWLVRERWHVVQNAADVDRIDSVLEKEAGPREPHFTALSVARLEPVKSPFVLLEAFTAAGNADSRLAYIGRGSLESDLNERIAELGMEGRVVLTGLIPRNKVFARLARSHVLISTSKGEGLPVAVIEAMAAQCPVILSDIPPHREVADGAGFIPLVPPNDVEGFATEIRRLQSMSPDELRELGRICREHVLARFTLPIMHSQLDEVYRHLPGLSEHPALVEESD
jgi:glycosyltransferase involved in cell wall biosynthesis